MDLNYSIKISFKFDFMIEDLENFDSKKYTLKNKDLYIKVLNLYSQYSYILKNTWDVRFNVLFGKVERKWRNNLYKISKFFKKIEL